jgi:hypothetical protein
MVPPRNALQTHTAYCTRDYPLAKQPTSSAVLLLKERYKMVALSNWIP